MYCTYLTTYRGSKLPMFYIGSTSITKIDKGYRGSVSSKKYKQIWIRELKLHPELFKTSILTRHLTRTLALHVELKFHIALNVVKSNMYINESLAAIDGCFGRDATGANNGMYGKLGSLHPAFGLTRSIETIEKMKASHIGMIGRKHSDKSKMKMSESFSGAGNAFYGKTHSNEALSKMKASQSLIPKTICPHCSKSGHRGAMARWHFDNCKSKCH